MPHIDRKLTRNFGANRPCNPCQQVLTSQKPEQEVADIPDYPALYLHLFHAQADAIAQLSDINESLIRVHQEAKEAVMNAPDPVVRLMSAESEDSE